MAPINMSEIFKYFIVSFVIILNLIDNQMRCRSTIGYTHSLSDCFHLCFGVRACVKHCKQGYNFENRYETSRYENEEPDEDYGKHNNYYQIMSRSRDNPYKHIRYVDNKQRNQRNGRKFDRYRRSSTIRNHYYNPVVNENDDYNEDDGYHGHTISNANISPILYPEHRKRVKFYAAHNTVPKAKSTVPKAKNIVPKAKSVVPKAKNNVPKTRSLSAADFQEEVVKIEFADGNITSQTLQRSVADPLLTNPSHCGFRFRNPSRDGLGVDGMGRIVGGKDAEPNEFPWLVSLQLLKNNGSPSQHFCGASIISKYYLLTAAHCTESLKEKEPTVIGKAGINSLSEEGQILYPEKFIVHEGWNADQQINDIALVKLKSPVKYELNKQDQYIVNAICLPEDTKDPVDPAVLAGWGQLAEEDAKTADWLQKITLPIFDRHNCRVNYRQYMKVLETHICAGGKGGEDSCMGDSGGPLVQKRDDRTFQIGLVSFGIPCAIKGLPGVYTHLIYFMDWIKKNMIQNR